MSNTFLMDDTCGAKRDCARYCNDETFAVMYCESDCQFNNEIMYSVCNSGDLQLQDVQFEYLLSDSTTFKLNGKIWNGRTWFSNLLSGRFFTDKLVLTNDYRYNSTSNLEIQNAIMVDGLMLDDMLFGSNALLGFGPNENNIVSQLFAQNLIPSPIVHFTLRLSGTYNWTEHSSKHKNRWVLELEKVELNGIQYKKKVKALITNHIKYIHVPSEFMNKLVDANIIKKLNETESVIRNFDYFVDCDQLLELQMIVDGRLWTIPNSFLQWNSETNMCIPLFKQIDLSRYDTEIDMIFGMPFLNRFCVSFDYERMVIRLAEQIE
ncbi:hypothetical protein M3Y98_00098000 [Aphelenchoides besseyi]|nr:hypothetical protein M3Y98_00098000 [Aphelenchoides besseyi]